MPLAEPWEDPLPRRVAHSEPMALTLGAADLWLCAGILGQVPALAWLGLSAVIVCGLIYWALDFYFLEALLSCFAIAVEVGTESPVSRLVAERCVSLKRR